MQAFQGIIYIGNGKISGMEPDAGYVRIIAENSDEKFPGAFAYPGLTDSHGHVGALGANASGTDLSQAHSPAECVEMMRTSPAMRGSWIYARGWNQELWSDNSFPDRKILDEAFGDTPAFFVRIDGHAGWANSEALRIAGITGATKPPAGGEIIKRKNGKPSGVLLDTAMDLLRRHIPDYSDEQIAAFYVEGMKSCVSEGLTEVHNMDVRPRRLELIRKLDREGKLPIRMQCYLSAQEDEWLKALLDPSKGEFLSVRGLKFFADGALGSRGAALLKPYSDAPHTKGLTLISREILYTKALKGIDQGFDIAVHAIGDAANRLALDVFANIRRATGFGNNILRIEHAQHVHPADMQRFADLDVIPSVHPMHCISDAATMSRQRLGDRCDYSYPWKSFIDAGVHPAGGSDFPIEPHNPMTGIDGFVRRTPHRSKAPWYPGEKLSRKEAIKAYTEWAHVASGESRRRGKLAKGYDADISIADRDIYNCSASEIVETKAIATIVAGDVVYQIKI
jgi:predicted amidohydrolase YtcJ